MSFLDYRKLKFVVDDVLSDEYGIDIVTPQKSVLELMFLIFINDLLEFLNYVNLNMYADDTCLII